MEAQFIKEIVESVDFRTAQEYCGEKYARGNGESRSQRAGTTTRTATTSAGTHEFTLHHVKDT
jgi:hypothetical protein